ncbi:peptide ABC transporter substrate-binding protein [Candidatus Chlamydia corallus]|uniref:peptide ABC transporter substrate-binding protein n=1 Tax=Candidatus Chlamydia corallus TaxID=2038470 RepID=UPI000C2FD1AA|nr:peptide ABC transporter substrate-binding protein [Candidatus Chlamydia corallus]
MFRFLILYITALSLVSLGCSSSQRSKGTFVVNMKEMPRSFDPRKTRLIADQTLIRHIYEGLVEEHSESGEIKTALAESYTISENRTLYTFKIKNIFWSNGDTLTAQDFVSSWKEILKEDISSIYTYAFLPIKNARAIFNHNELPENLGVRALDDRHLEIQLEAPCAHFLYLLTLPIFFPVHETFRNRSTSFQEMAITCGVFRPVSLEHGRRLYLEKNSMYHNKSCVRLNKIIIQFISDPNTAAILFKHKKLDWQGPPWGEPIPPEISASLHQDDQLFALPGTSTTWLIFNIQKSPWNNSKLRKALSLAIDKDILTKVVYQGLAEPTDHILNKRLYPGTYPQRATQSKRSIEAKELFEEALSELQITREDLEKETLAFSTFSFSYGRICQILREQWKKVLGFTIPIVGQEFFMIHKNLLEGNYSLTVNQWTGSFIDPMSYLMIFAYPGGISPYVLEDLYFQTLLTKITQEHKKKPRDQFVIEALDYLENLHFLEPLCHPNLRIALNKNIKNFNFLARRTSDFRFIEEL